MLIRTNKAGKNRMQQSIMSGRTESCANEPCGVAIEMINRNVKMIAAGSVTVPSNSTIQLKI